MPPWGLNPWAASSVSVSRTRTVGRIRFRMRPELRAFVADGIANGIRPWFAKFNAKVIDKRWMEPVAQTYDWCWRNEKYLRNTGSLARVAMVYSQRTAQRYGGSAAAEKVENHTLGFYHALIEARVPFEMAHDELLEGAASKYKLLVLPNIAALSDKQCTQLRNYVRDGGSIVATHETSLYDETGNRRKDFGLADVFGCSFERQKSSVACKMPISP